MEFLSQGNFWGMYFVAFLGMIAHFLKKQIRGETFTAMGKWFATHPKYTILAVISMSVGVVAYYTQLSTGMAADYIAVFTIGFSLDSMLNKWDEKDTPI